MARKQHILIIEDDPASLELFSLLLEDFGYIPLRAADGEQGLALARREHLQCERRRLAPRQGRRDAVRVARQPPREEPDDRRGRGRGDRGSFPVHGWPSVSAGARTATGATISSLCSG